MEEVVRRSESIASMNNEQQSQIRDMMQLNLRQSRFMSGTCREYDGRSSSALSLAFTGKEGIKENNL